MRRHRPGTVLTRASFVFAMGLLLQQCGSGPAQSTGGEGDAAFQVVATNDQLMDSIIVPNSQAIWDAVVFTNGEVESSPKTDDDWYRLQMNALALAESGNLLKMAPRTRDGEWNTFSTQLTERSRAVLRAAEAKDIQALLVTGGEVYNVCTDCHRAYISPDAAIETPIPGN